MGRNLEGYNSMGHGSGTYKQRMPPSVLQFLACGHYYYYIIIIFIIIPPWYSSLPVAIIINATRRDTVPCLWLLLECHPPWYSSLPVAISVSPISV